MIRLGAYEVGASHYPFMIAMHISFFISLILEVVFFERTLSPLFSYLLVFFLLVQALRIWCLRSLGIFWNTKIIVLPGARVCVVKHWWSEHSKTVTFPIQQLVCTQQLRCLRSALSKAMAEGRIMQDTCRRVPQAGYLKNWLS